MKYQFSRNDMGYASDIILVEEALRYDVESYEGKLPERNLAERIRDCQEFCDERAESSIAKVLILFLSSEREIKHEVRRIFSWQYKSEKRVFLISQLKSQNEEVLIAAIELLGVLRDDFAIPSLGNIFDIKRVDLCKSIVTALGEMENPLAARIIMRALVAENKELALLAIRKLSRWIEEVQWRTFKKLLHSKDEEIRREATFAIALRKSPKSSRRILKSIAHETDRVTKLHMIQYVGMIPSKKSIIPLLKIIARDPDQKARLYASRTLDRLQGLLKRKEIFKLRDLSDISMRSEILFRIGKFGSEDERHKQYLRGILETTKEKPLKEACIQALGYIAEHEDIELLTKYLRDDPVTSYNAAMALTHIWRLEDNAKVLEALQSDISSITKQIIIRYLIRRRGSLIDPELLFTTTKKLLDKDDNINVQYLGLALMEHAPCENTVEYLLEAHQNTEDIFKHEAIEASLANIVVHHNDFALSVMQRCTKRNIPLLIRSAPPATDVRFSKSLFEGIFERFPEAADDNLTKEIRNAIFDILRKTPGATCQLMITLPNADWKRFILSKLLLETDKKILNAIRMDLILLLGDEDINVRATAMTLILKLKDPTVIPEMIAFAEKDTTGEIKSMAQQISKRFIQEGVL